MKNETSNNVQLYPYEYVYKGNRTILIWQSDPQSYDSFKLQNDKNMIEARSEIELRRILKDESKKVLWSEKSSIDFDEFWIAINNLKQEQDSSQNTCEIILAGWNFLEDMGKTFGHSKELERLKSPILNKCYDKIFYGNNLLPVEGPYHPNWSSDELNAMKKELKEIWDLFIKNNYIH